MGKEKITLRVVLLTLGAAIPFTALWFLVFSYFNLGILPLGFRPCPDIISLQWFILFLLVHELFLFVPRWLVIRLTNAREIPVWIVAHLPVAFVIAWGGYFLFDTFASRCF